MAGQLADSIGAELLVLNHHKDSVLDNTQERAREAMNVIQSGTRVLSANDFMEILVPREGFKFLDRQSPIESCQGEEEQNDSELRAEVSSAPKASLLPAENAPSQNNEATGASKVTRAFDAKDAFNFSRKL